MNTNSLIRVCDNCKQASCWLGQYMCDNADYAGTIDLPVKELRKLNLEDESFWEDAIV